jgi:outer membrane protein OmpA-like peptidoglycan-associated protein
MKALLITPLWALGVMALVGCSTPDPPKVLDDDEVYEPTLVFFGWDSTEVTKQGLVAVKQVVRAFRKRPGCITLRAHADTSGSADYNMDLSARRGDAVMEALVREGVPRSAITVIARGQQGLMVPTPDGVRKPQNRYVRIYTGACG